MKSAGSMSNIKRKPEKYQLWIDVRRRYHLSDVHIQMARELGMNPKKFGKIANEKQEPWKAPLPAFIERIYLKRFGRERPVDVKSIEEVFKI
jgi:GH25 family lysozyme M1 (1,4-beta-N-acetylmuramidase)